MLAMVNMHCDETLLAPMGLLRTRNERTFGEAELRGLRRLAPHLNRAIRVNLRLMEMEARARATADMSDRALVALALTDAKGRVAEVNALARAILAEDDGLTIRDDALRAARGEDCTRLARLIAEAAGGAGRSSPPRMSGVMQIWRPSGRRRLSLVVAPTRNASSPFGRSHGVSVAFSNPERAPEPDPSLLARVYGITARETSIAALLLQGRNPGEAAAVLGMAENTARTHVRHLLSKTGAKRIGDLVRILMQGPGIGQH
jgi:DNA-binding CsgD family transcriptional regulator